MDWKKKLSSRKLWVAVAGLITSIIVIFGVGDNTVAQIGAVIGAIGSVCAYIFGESAVDVARADKEKTDDNDTNA
jgi:hypothetical protein